MPLSAITMRNNFEGAVVAALARIFASRRRIAPTRSRILPVSALSWPERILSLVTFPTPGSVSTTRPISAAFSLTAARTYDKMSLTSLRSKKRVPST